MVLATEDNAEWRTNEKERKGFFTNQDCEMREIPQES